MACEYCNREGCLAYATLGGFSILIGDDRTLAEIYCRNATRDRALRAEAIAEAGISVAAALHAARHLSIISGEEDARSFLRGAMAVRDAMVEAGKAWEEYK